MQKEKKTSQINAHPLQGKHLYLIILAFEKSLNIFKGYNSALQITCGSLTCYKTRQILSVRGNNKKKKNVFLQYHITNINNMFYITFFCDKAMEDRQKEGI